MKLKNNCLSPLIFVLTLLILSNSCKKEDNNTALTVTDVDGNLYHTVTIGTQIWMVENLKTTRYNDSTEIPLATGIYEWPVILSPRYCWYDNDISKKNIYGALYNWNAVNSIKLCPTGWHVPTDEEWKILTDFLGGESIAGGKLKETGTTHWLDPNKGATNETGFSALPGGARSNFGTFYNIGKEGYWWSSTESSNSFFVVLNRSLDYDTSYVDRATSFKEFGFSVRCIKD